MADKEAESGLGLKVKVPTKPRHKTRPKKLPPYNVVLLDDDDHTYEYVIRMLCSIFSCSTDRGMKMATEVDSNGRVIVFTTHRELAELKRDQILAYGADPLVMSSRRSMDAVIEPAERSDD